MNREDFLTNVTIGDKVELDIEYIINGWFGSKKEVKTQYSGYINYIGPEEVGISTENPDLLDDKRICDRLPKYKHIAAYRILRPDT